MDKSRTEALIGKEKATKLALSKIAVVGIGGVGGYAALMLARAGVEKMKLIDFDVVSPSNLNRQVIAFQNTIGRAKVEVMKEMLLSINENMQIEAINDRLCQDNVSRYIENVDYVIDAIDSTKDKLALIIYCKTHNINIISAMGAGNRYDVPHFYLTDIYKTHNDGLAKVIRRELRKAGVSSLDVVTCDSLPQKVEGVIGSISYYPAACGIQISSVVVNKIINS